MCACAPGPGWSGSSALPLLNDSHDTATSDTRRHANDPRNRLAVALVSINTGHPVRQQLEGVLSPMGDFNRVMTVRQRVDRYAFIRGTSECDPILWR